MPIIENKLITSTDWKPGDKPKDGISMCNGMHWDVKNCIVDLTDWPMYKTDEACGITWGSSAEFDSCVVRGVGKSILCGCGDDPDDPKNALIRDKILAERGKSVTFNNCIIENFCRRGPEVQDGMVVRLNNCLVFNWGYNDKFDTRAFGAWAHDGGEIYAENTLFIKGSGPNLINWFKDHINHFGQAVNDRGFFKALFHRDAWLSGYKRALTAGVDGHVEAKHCYATYGLVMDNSSDKMSDKEAYSRLLSFVELKKCLGQQLGWDYQGDLDMEADDYID